MPRDLSTRQQIRDWAAARGGNPMLFDMPDPVSGTRQLLQITFGQHALNADGNEGPDRPAGGFRLVSWQEWFEEFDRQGLTMRVRDDDAGELDNDFEFVAREGDTTGAAQQPPAATVERPDRNRDAPR